MVLTAWASICGACMGWGEMAGLEQKAPGRRMKKAGLQCRPSDLESLPSSVVSSVLIAIWLCKMSQWFQLDSWPPKLFCRWFFLEPFWECLRVRLFGWPVTLNSRNPIRCFFIQHFWSFFWSHEGGDMKTGMMAVPWVDQGRASRRLGGTFFWGLVGLKIIKL